MSNLQEKKEDYILSLDNSGQLTKMDIIEQNLNAIDFGYELCKRECEEKVNELLSALEQIANATQPFNAFENEVFVSVATDIARKALSFYNAT